MNINLPNDHASRNAKSVVCPILIYGHVCDHYRFFSIESVIHDMKNDYYGCTSQIFLGNQSLDRGQPALYSMREKNEERSKLKQPRMRGHKGLLCGLAEA